MACYVFNKTLYSHKAAWAAKQAAVDANVEHLGSVQTVWVTLCVQTIKAVFEVLKKWVAM
jgi:hypothetical protein